MFLAVSHHSYASSLHVSCQTTIIQYEQQHHIPTGLLKAIAKQESNLIPYAIGHTRSEYFTDLQSALTKAEQLVRDKKYNFDLGCMQINYYWHFKNFGSLKEMLTIENNVQYAAGLLTKLYMQHGSWFKAVRYYHSSNRCNHKPYARKILLNWIKD